MFKNKGLSHEQVYLYNTRIKYYKDGTKKLVHHDYVTMIGFQCNTHTGSYTENIKTYKRECNLYNTKQNIIDLSYENGLQKPWEYFVTLTFDDKKVDARNYDAVSVALQKWLNNMKHQNKDMQYIIVAEPHPTSGRLHYHGIFKNVPNWKLGEARTPRGRLIKKNNKQIYNLLNYHYGFTTVSKIEDLASVSVYISKYITKELLVLHYKKRYWCSTNLIRPRMEYAEFSDSDLKFFIDTNKVKNMLEKNKLLHTTTYVETYSTNNLT